MQEREGEGEGSRGGGVEMPCRKRGTNSSK